jgi:hypothetical protein
MKTRQVKEAHLAGFLPNEKNYMKLVLNSLQLLLLVLE